MASLAGGLGIWHYATLSLTLLCVQALILMIILLPRRSVVWNEGKHQKGEGTITGVSRNLTFTRACVLVHQCLELFFFGPFSASNA